jgi:hypothetical protein
MGNCKGIPDYTPVGMFSFGAFVQDGSAVAGIITDCTANGFKVRYYLRFMFMVFSAISS